VSGCVRVVVCGCGVWILVCVVGVGVFDGAGVGDGLVVKLAIVMMEPISMVWVVVRRVMVFLLTMRSILQHFLYLRHTNKKGRSLSLLAGQPDFTLMVLNYRFHQTQAET